MASPIEVLKQANAAYPASNLVWAAIAVAAAVAVISAMNLGVETLTGGAIFVLIIIIAFAVVSLFHRMLSKVDSLPGARILAAIIAWSFTLFILGFMAGLMSSFFFGVPRELQELFSGLKPIEITETADIEPVEETVVPAPEESDTVAPAADLQPATEDQATRSLIVITDDGVATLQESDPVAELDTCLEAIDRDLPVPEFKQSVLDCQSANGASQ